MKLNMETIMKLLSILIASYFLILIGCGSKKVLVNHFNSQKDTLVIEAKKIKGLGLFPYGAGHIYFKDTTERYYYPIIFPKNINNIKLASKLVDFKPLHYTDMLKDKSAYMKTFLKENYPRKIDTLKIPSIKDNSISIMSGIRGKDTVFIVDQNNNKDFRDDSIRLFREIDWRTASKLITCKYNVFDGKTMKKDSTWANIGTLNPNEVLFFVSNHLEATFSIDGQNYQIGVVDGQSNFCFDEPIIALTVQNGTKKDTLLETELLKKNEYLKLKDTYYRFSDVSNDGKYITLIKEKDFSSKIGTQVGMTAPDFKCRSIDGDSIFFKTYKGKYLLLINVSACWSRISSYKCYKELTDVYKNKLNFIGLDNSPVALKNNIKSFDLPGPFTIVEENGALLAYRPGFCSRVCFLINPDGRIIDKFEVFDWKSNLEKDFKTN